MLFQNSRAARALSENLEQCYNSAESTIFCDFPKIQLKKYAVQVCNRSLEQKQQFSIQYKQEERLLKFMIESLSSSVKFNLVQTKTSKVSAIIFFILRTAGAKDDILVIFSFSNLHDDRILQFVCTTHALSLRL